MSCPDHEVETTSVFSIGEIESLPDLFKKAPTKAFKLENTKYGWDDVSLCLNRVCFTQNILPVLEMVREKAPGKSTEQYAKDMWANDFLVALNDGQYFKVTRKSTVENTIITLKMTGGGLFKGVRPPTIKFKELKPFHIVSFTFSPQLQIGSQLAQQSRRHIYLNGQLSFNINDPAQASKANYQEAVKRAALLFMDFGQTAAHDIEGQVYVQQYEVEEYKANTLKVNCAFYFVINKVGY